ncbi:MAG: hypothetical protein LBH46_00750 [Rickettsiales bacterium]|jgi:hypothetical protein|nr:hypothetical protein [Rickettsiales bacterium]
MEYLFVQPGFTFGRIYLFRWFLKKYKKQDIKNALDEGKTLSINILGVDYQLKKGV